MIFKKIDPTNEGQTLFSIDNQAFCRDFDLRAKSVEQEINYLKDSEVYLIYENDQPIGLFAYRTGRDIEITCVAIIPGFQGKGIGTKVIQDILDKNKGLTIWLVTHPRNTAALLVYLKLRFVIDSWIDNYYGDGQPRLKLVKFSTQK